MYFLPKPFSKNKDDLQDWLNRWLKIKDPWEDYKNWLEKHWYLDDILLNFQEKTVLIIEVWGCFSKVINSTNKNNIKWLVEVTTFWHNRHLEAWTNVILPTYSIARSPIKEREARHVWLAIYRSVDGILHELNRAIVDCNITMVWYWMIWKNVCNAFKWCKNVKVYDKSTEAILTAENEWFEASDNYLDVILDSDIIIASTWWRSINEDFIKACKDWVLLVSWGSRQNEIDVDFLEVNSQIYPEEIHKYIKRFLINGKNIYLFRDWKNANFSSKSCPSSSMDLIHAEVLVCVRNILNWKYIVWERQINETTDEERKGLLNLHHSYWK
jgi:adenosylhomocysteinase